MYSTIHVAEDKQYMAKLWERRKKVEEIKEDTPTMSKEHHTEETVIAEYTGNAELTEEIYKVIVKFTKALEPDDQENLSVIKM